MISDGQMGSAAGTGGVNMHGRKIGHWTVVKENPDGSWHCRCVCGEERSIPENLLLAGIPDSCGCRKSRARDLRGLRFGLLTALEPVAERARDGSVRWRCLCDCGRETVVSSSKLLHQHTSSCGCKKIGAFDTGKHYIDGTCLEILFTPKLRSNNTSGCTGVYQRQSKWLAYITVGSKRYWLGRYERFEDAVNARKNAEEEWKEKLSADA